MGGDSLVQPVHSLNHLSLLTIGEHLFEFKFNRSFL